MGPGVERNQIMLNLQDNHKFVSLDTLLIFDLRDFRKCHFQLLDCLWLILFFL